MGALIIITLFFCGVSAVFIFMFRIKIKNFFTTNIKNFLKRINCINWKCIVIAIILAVVALIILFILILAIPALAVVILAYFTLITLIKIIIPGFNLISILKNKIKFTPEIIIIRGFIADFKEIPVYMMSVSNSLVDDFYYEPYDLSLPTIQYNIYLKNETDEPDAIEIPAYVYLELEKQKDSLKDKEITLFFKQYLLLDLLFENYKIEMVPN